MSTVKHNPGVRIAGREMSYLTIAGKQGLVKAIDYLIEFVQNTILSNAPQR